MSEGVGSMAPSAARAEAQSDAADEPILLRQMAGGVVTLTLNRPRAFNSLSKDLLGALLSEVDALAIEYAGDLEAVELTSAAAVERAAGRAQRNAGFIGFRFRCKTTLIANPGAQPLTQQHLA